MYLFLENRDEWYNQNEYLQTSYTRDIAEWLDTRDQEEPADVEPLEEIKKVFAMGQIEFENGVRGIVECGTLAPDQPGKNMFWLNAGATVYGSGGYAQVIVGSGWQAVTRSSSGLISGPGGFDVVKDQSPYIKDLADWLDNPTKIHPCNGEVTYHGFELAMGICLSSLEKRKINLPLKTSEPIVERLRRELSDDVPEKGEEI